MTDAYLLLWLEGPLQSWGYDSIFDRRETLDFPTKSGVMGLLCCALGASGEQRELLERMAPLDMQVLAFTACDKNKRKKRQPHLMDFHMVGSAYNDNDIWQNLLIPKKADGKKSVGTGSKLTYRYYLQDMAFAVILQIPIEEQERFSHALQYPVWDLYLGRKNCPPTKTIYQGYFTDMAQARAHALELLEQDNKGLKRLIFEVIQCDTANTEDEQLILRDVPIQFGPVKIYQERIVEIIHHQE